jgi:ketosteroid isomerase-like protein
MAMAGNTSIPMIRWIGKWFLENMIRKDGVKNKREIKKIVISEEMDGAFAVVDIDTLWIDKNGKEDNWKGRVCKVYSKVGSEWKMTMHTGVLVYPCSQ